MVIFILKRLVAGVLLWLLLLLLCLWLIRLIPGSYEDLSKLEAPMEETQSLSTSVSVPVFYWSLVPDPGAQQSLSDLLPQVKWNGRSNAFHQQLGQYARLDFGRSLIDQLRVSDKIKPALLWSLALQIPAIFLIVALSLWIGFRLVRFPDSGIWSGVNAGLLGLHSIPGFWLATLLLLLFANPDAIAWFPTGMQ
ncbi:MAG TPA: hypothetical protein VFX48_07110, partial [Saprospiraceae bacterium]|nr:hypothetical protein [Saprospiraceae bacterium]